MESVERGRIWGGKELSSRSLSWGWTVSRIWGLLGILKEQSQMGDIGTKSEWLLPQGSDEMRQDEGVWGLSLFIAVADGYYRFVSAVKEVLPHCVWSVFVDIIHLEEFILNPMNLLLYQKRRRNWHRHSQWRWPCPDAQRYFYHVAVRQGIQRQLETSRTQRKGTEQMSLDFSANNSAFFFVPFWDRASVA